ncbi:abortive infection family protein [Pseudanabaena minima]|uniref:abortive infection family protein n=1 Tax=Pseudanabaena minima TaxID=890415 RepID=UPI003DA8F1C4
MTESQEQYSLTANKIQCGHCAIKSLMRIICEGEDSYVFGDEEYGGDDVYHKWQILKCLACSEINILHNSSSSLWEYELDSETSIRPTYIDILYPHQISEKPLELKISNEVIERAIADIEVLILSRGAVSGVDRIHTALHGYLRAICIRENIVYSKDDSIVKLFKLLRQQHPKLQSTDRTQDIDRLLQSFAGILDSLNPIRNHASMAHPNDNVLEKDEALLFINVVRTLLRYIDGKLI